MLRTESRRASGGTAGEFDRRTFSSCRPAMLRAFGVSGEAARQFPWQASYGRSSWRWREFFNINGHVSAGGGGGSGGEIPRRTLSTALFFFLIPNSFRIGKYLLNSNFKYQLGWLHSTAQLSPAQPSPAQPVVNIKCKKVYSYSTLRCRRLA
jgi:hypothetical protein